MLKLRAQQRLRRCCGSGDEAYRYEREVEEFLRWSPSVQSAPDHGQRPWRPAADRVAHLERTLAALQHAAAAASADGAASEGPAARARSPLASYDDLSAEEVIEIASSLEPGALAELRRHEAAPRSRDEVLAAFDRNRHVTASRGLSSEIPLAGLNIRIAGVCARRPYRYHHPLGGCAVTPVSYLRTTVSHGKPSSGDGRRMPAPLRGGSGRYIALAVVLVLAGVVVAAVLLVTASPSLSADSSALAKVGMPLGGGTIESATATTAAGRPVPLEVRGDQLWPRKLVPARTLIAVTAVVKRPGWMSWLSGSSTTLHLRSGRRAPPCARTT